MKQGKTMTCPQCGTVLESGFRFCGNCGTRIDGGDSIDNPKDAAPSSSQETSSSAERVFGRKVRTLRLRNHFTFHGRTRRTTFFGVTLVVFLSVFYFVALMNWVTNQAKAGTGPNTIVLVAATVVGIHVFSLCFIWLVHQIRRLHDIGLSGIFVLLGVVPVIGWLFLLMADTMDGCSGPNRYGPDPRARKPNGNAIPWKAFGVLGIELLAWVAIVVISFLLRKCVHSGLSWIKSFNAPVVLSSILYLLFVVVFWRKVLKKQCIKIFDYNCKLSASLLAILGAFVQFGTIVYCRWLLVVGFVGVDTPILYLWWPFVWPLFTLVYPICDMVVTRRRQAKHNKS